jgi:glucan phosphoethanolaminetransferase (alkaline phosphatase superfamily)
MKANLGPLATAWAYSALGLTIVAEVTSLILGMRFLAPACRRVLTYVDTDVTGYYAFMPGAKTFLALLHSAAYQTLWWMVAFAIAWALFEWSVKVENKQRFRLSILASLALTLFVVTMIFTVLLIVPTAKAADRLNARDPGPEVAARIATLDRLLPQLEQALLTNDLPKAGDLAHTAMGAANDLENTGAAASTLPTSTEQAKVEVLRADLNSMASAMREAWIAARRRHPEQIQVPMQKFREAYAGVKDDTAKLAK